MEDNPSVPHKATGVSQKTTPEFTEVSVATYEGIFPAPEVVRAYEQLVPNAAERILALTESEAKHRQEIEKATLEANIADMQADRKAEKRGQYLAFTVCTLVIISASVTAFCGHEIAGAAIAGMGIAGIISAFITRTK